MTEREIIRIDAGSEDYWHARREAFALIREAERAAKRVAEAPMYLHGGYDGHGDVIPVENLGPYEALDKAIRAIFHER